MALLNNNTPSDDLDGGTDDLKGYQSKLHGRTPQVENFHHFDEEIDFICKRLSELQQEGVPL